MQNYGQFLLGTLSTTGPVNIVMLHYLAATKYGNFMHIFCQFQNNESDNNDESENTNREDAHILEEYLQDLAAAYDIFGDDPPEWWDCEDTQHIFTLLLIFTISSR